MNSSARPALGKLARPSGALAMVAIDQRESLRTMFAEARGGPVTDDILITFKEAVAEMLAPYASAMLFDRHFGMQAFEVAARTAPGCGRILAADALTQLQGGPVESTDIDEAVVPADISVRGGVGLKLLLVWRGEATRERNVEIAHRFMDRCRSAGLSGIVEAIVQPETESSREKLLVHAARELASTKPDLYKCQVPYLGRARDAEIMGVCEDITSASASPWVVLSQGVAADEFARSVELACRAGASGFLAGRAIWADTIRHEDYREQLRSVSVPRLRTLINVVDNSARPWHVVVSSVDGSQANKP